MCRLRQCKAKKRLLSSYGKPSEKNASDAVWKMSGSGIGDEDRLSLVAAEQKGTDMFATDVLK